MFGFKELCIFHASPTSERIAGGSAMLAVKDWGGLMRVSVIVRSKDEADRLRLTLTSLACQTVLSETIVVNDGSTDHTREILAEAGNWLNLRIVTHATPQGRARASNAGARLATGEILLFLDGDTIAGPDLIARHVALHDSAPRLVGRGETFHLRGTRFLLNPETGKPRPGEEARLARLTPDEFARLLVTRRQVIEDFAAIACRAEPGIYPGAGPRLLYELEMDALHHHPGCAVLWAAASGHNLSMHRDEFLGAGGFLERPDFDLTAHRELAFRLCLGGARMVPVPAARTYHLTHRSGWRDPLRCTAWEQAFYETHPTLAVKLLSIFWANLSAPNPIPHEARIKSLPELEIAARGDTGIDYDAIRRLIPTLPILPARATATATGAD